LHRANLSNADFSTTRPLALIFANAQMQNVNLRNPTLAKLICGGELAGADLQGQFCQLKASPNRSIYSKAPYDSWFALVEGVDFSKAKT